jgi:putative transcriptional regulator
MKNIKLKLARVEKDLSQEELAKIVGVSRQTIVFVLPYAKRYPKR